MIMMTSYSTYIKTRPPSWEETAIIELLTVTKETRTDGPAEGAHLHIVHISNARASLDLIKGAKSSSDSITVETCPYYLAFSAEAFRMGIPISNVLRLSMMQLTEKNYGRLCWMDTLTC